MAKPARIRLAGTIAATVLCAAAATEAAAQDGTIVLNQQLQLGDVFAGQTLNVVDSQDQVTVETSAQGNSASGAVENGSITLATGGQVAVAAQRRSLVRDGALIDAVELAWRFDVDGQQPQ